MKLPLSARNWASHSPTSVIDADGTYIAECGGLAGEGEKASKARAARIAKCVNACEGIEDPAAWIRKQGARLALLEVENKQLREQRALESPDLRNPALRKALLDVARAWRGDSTERVEHTQMKLTAIALALLDSTMQQEKK